MTREEHLKFCKKCTNRKMDMQQGLLCKLTGAKADFEGECKDFNLDETVKEEPREEKPKSPVEIIAELPEDIKEQLRPHQDLPYAIIGGFALSLIGALLWAVITVATEYQIGYMALAVGLLVGLGVRYFGAGIDQVYGYIGGFFALLGCLLGNLFSQVGFFANEQGMSYFDTLSFLDLETIILIYQETFSVIDVLFYGIAIYEGYKFAFRPVPENFKEIEDFTPAYSKLRMPLVVVSFLIISLAGFKLSKGANGEQVYYYESGIVQAEGELANGVEHGNWKYYYENGELQLTGDYENGIETGIWDWYYESGERMRSGTYNNGLNHGAWLNYNEDGVLVDSTVYSTGRMNGLHKAFYEDATLYEQGNYERDRQTGEWNFYHTNGSLLQTGQYQDGEHSGLWKFMDFEGNPIREVEYIDDKNFRILNVWDLNGNQIVSDGNGTFTSFYEDGSVAEEGQLEDGKQIGIWKSYYLSGSLKETGEYKEDQYVIISALKEDGTPMVEEGNGDITRFLDTTLQVLEEGAYKDGLKQGYWTVYYPFGDAIQQEATYNKGKLSGVNITYYSNGGIFVEGTLDNDKKEGEWTWYYENGIVQCTASYENGLKQGDQIFWSEMGREAKKETYENGELKSEELL